MDVPVQEVEMLSHDTEYPIEQLLLYSIESYTKYGLALQQFSDCTSYKVHSISHHDSQDRVIEILLLHPGEPGDYEDKLS